MLPCPQVAYGGNQEPIRGTLSNLSTTEVHKEENSNPDEASRKQGHLRKDIRKTSNAEVKSQMQRASEVPEG